MHQVKAYIKFLFRSTNQHGVHSPFVYNLVTRCFYDRKKYPAYETIREYRKKLFNLKETIIVTDLGAGSRVFSSNERKISAIAANAGITPKQARLLNRLVNYLEVKSILELGTSLGISTAAMAAANEVQITTIEGCPETAAVAKKQFQEFGFKKIDLHTGKFETVLRGIIAATGKGSEGGSRGAQINNDRHQPTTIGPPMLPESPEPITTIDLVYIDGHHQKEATLRYFQQLLPLAHNDSLFIFDDIHWSKGMEEAWEEIKKNKKVKVTIDIFQWGLVFFRKEQEKEHFTIRV